MSTTTSSSSAPPASFSFPTRDDDDDDDDNDQQKQEIQKVLDKFYQWRVEWCRGLKPQDVLVKELTHQLLAPHFTWVDAHDGHVDEVLGSNNQERSTLFFGQSYGSGATYLQLSIKVKQLVVLQDPQQQPSPPSNPHHHHHHQVLVTAQVWQTLVQEEQDKKNSTTQPEPQMSVKQVSIWLEKRQPPSSSNNDDGSRWILLHLHETFVKGPTQDGSLPPPPQVGVVATDTATTTTSSSHTTNPSNHLNPNHNPWKTSTVASRRRHIATKPILEQSHAKPLLWNQSLVGISIAGWDIGTSQGPIGDQAWFQQALEELEPISQYKLLSIRNNSNNNNQKRQLVLPEMVFPSAHVVLERRQHGDFFISFDAMDAFKEWSQAHQAIPLPNDDYDDDDDNDDTNKGDQDSSSVSYRGVSVLKSSDASLWKQKQQSQSPHESSSSSKKKQDTINIGSTTFHYDWTYSTPFCGNVYGTQKRPWIPLEQSGMPMQLLTDQSVPILYFDSVILYEDDLHDNGQVEYTVKVRVMPTCAYILCKLFLRIDHVLLRVRECRLLVEFSTQTIFRDITWRECAWKDLPLHHLPTEVRAWTTISTVVPDGEQHAETPAFLHLLSKLPLVGDDQLPNDLTRHAQLSYTSSPRPKRPN